MKCIIIGLVMPRDFKYRKAEVKLYNNPNHDEFEYSFVRRLNYNFASLQC